MAICFQAVAQTDQPTFLLFEFMQVDNEQEADYAETEEFWSKIHEQRVNSGESQGWDLWRLLPGGEMQHFQYLTVHIYNDPVKMMEGGPTSLLDHAKAAYPDMTEEQIMEKLNQSAKTRNLAVRLNLRMVDQTEGDYDMPVGSISRINMMKPKEGMGGDYVKAEREVFKPQHQKMVDAGQLGNWGIAAVMVPYGTEVYADYYTFDMYKDYAQMFGHMSYDGAPLTDEQQKAMQAGIATRDLKFSYIGELLMKVRKQ